MSVNTMSSERVCCPSCGAPARRVWVRTGVNCTGTCTPDEVARIEVTDEDRENGSGTTLRSIRAEQVTGPPRKEKGPRTSPACAGGPGALEWCSDWSVSCSGRDAFSARRARKDPPSRGASEHHKSNAC